MKKGLFLVTVVCLLALAFVGCAGSENEAAETAEVT